MKLQKCSDYEEGSQSSMETPRTVFSALLHASTLSLPLPVLFVSTPYSSTQEQSYDLLHEKEIIDIKITETSKEFFMALF